MRLRIFSLNVGLFFVCAKRSVPLIPLLPQAHWAGALPPAWKAGAQLCCASYCKVVGYPVSVVHPPPPEISTEVNTAASADRSRSVGRSAPVYRSELQGLRAVAVVLVAVYHIWFGRVSGGVDVFLVLTGFLITGSLVRMVERHGRVHFAAFWSRLAKRLFPSAAVVLLGVLTATFLWLPRSAWRDTLSEIIASALYYENWELATNAVDYLGGNGSASPVQHFWSLAVQGQFYLIWPLLMTVVAVLASRFGLRPRRVAFTMLAAVFTLSLTYSIVSTAANQQWAYFDTGTRLWELALGGLLALVIHRLWLPRPIRVVSGWFGLLSLVSCGMLVQVSTLFPGYIALWPTMAAVLVVLAGTTGSRVGADRLLTWRPLNYVGDLAYSLYLWHWPILVFYLEVTDRVRPSVIGGCYVLMLAFVLAAATKWVVEDGIQRLARTRKAPAWSLMFGAAGLVPVLAAASCWTAYMNHQEEVRAELASDQESYPGAAVFTDPSLAEELPSLPVYPDPAASRDLWLTHTNGCNVETGDSDLVSCEFGDPSAETTIAMVGDSHTGHWFPAVREVVEANGWRLIVMTKNACRLSTDTQYSSGEVFPDCEEWEESLMAELAEIRPSAVFTLATKTDRDDGEHTPGGYLERWQQLGELGIEVLAIRDSPRPESRVPTCIDLHGADDCVFDRSDSMAEVPPAEAAPDVPGNVSLIDLTEYFCRDGRCPTVIGNVMVFSDENHITATFSRSLAPMLETELKAATHW